MVIPYGRQSIDEADVTAVTEVLRGDWLTQGPAVDEFEAAVADVCEAPYAVAFSSGTAALHGAAFAAGLGPGDELVTSALTFAASANCAAYVGATPRFADIEASTWNVSTATVREALTSSTRAVVPVHYAGLPAPVEAIREAIDDDVLLIEDAAHALGARVGSEPIGSCRHSDMAIFSFHPVKAIAAGEGGIVTTRDPELRERLLSFRNHGFVREPARLSRSDGPWYHEQQMLGFNYRLTDIHSALGRSQLRRLEDFIASRNRIAASYREGLAEVEAIELPPAAPEGTLHAYHLFVVRHRDGAEARLRLYESLREREILAQVHYLPVYWHPYYKERFGYQVGLCPEAERHYESCLSLPCFPSLTAGEQDKVIRAVRELA
jgi:perosamine synthetase